MDKKLKVLLLVAEPWRKEDSGGNTLDNFVNGMQGVEFAHIYCDDRMPDNEVCTKYFQISENEVFHGFVKHKAVGRKLSMDEIDRRKQQCASGVKITNQVDCQGGGVISKVIRWVKRVRPNFVYTIRNFVWLHSNWRTRELNDFILSFEPNVIYAPCYANPFLLSLIRYVKDLTGCKIITWSADDCYSLRHYSLDPFFWFNRLWNRHCLRKTYSFFDEFYSISEEEAEEMEPIVGKKIGILRKGVVVPESFMPREVNKPIRFIYAGGLYLNRHKSLIEIANTLRQLNADGDVKAELHIYTGSQLRDRDANLLNDGRTVFNHGLISPDKLSQIYKESDVAIHCESFELKYRLMTRLSFSTKIIDCFQSGCAILAIAWKEHTGIKCLRREDAAICVTAAKDIDYAVTRLVKNPELIKEYAMKAYECEKRNHRIEDVQKKLYDSFVRCSKY